MYKNRLTMYVHTYVHTYIHHRNTPHFFHSISVSMIFPALSLSLSQVSDPPKHLRPRINLPKERKQEKGDIEKMLSLN